MSTKYIVIGSIVLVVVVIVFYLIKNQRESLVNAPTTIKNSSIGDILSGNSVDASRHSSTSTSGKLDVK